MSAASTTPTPTPTTNLEYDSLIDLRDAAADAGYSCDDWAQTDRVSSAAESGSCTDADVFATYVTDSDLQDQVDKYKELSDLYPADPDDPTVTLVGPNWTVHGDETPVVRLQDGIGGKILR